VIRDAAIRDQLIEAGWRVATVWECSLRKAEQLAATVELLGAWLLSESRQLEVGEKESSILSDRYSEDCSETKIC
jgi:DNA mismatch endonuclease (patch repair protein)